MRTLRTRFSLAFVLMAFLTSLLFGGLTYHLFVKQQWAHLLEVIERDLSHVQALVKNPEVGASFVAPQRGELILQFVSPEGRLLLPGQPSGDTPLLPLTMQPQIITVGEQSLLVSHTPWGSNGGTIRLGFDVDDALAVRQRLRDSLVASGILISLVAALVGINISRRTLSPLAELAEQARHIDPCTPQMANYSGLDDEVAEVAKALNAALENIRARQTAEHAFLAEIAHELAAPLMLVSGHLEALCKAEPANKQLMTARDAAQELLYTSQDLLMLARGELQRPLDLKVFSLADVVTRAAEEYPGTQVVVGSTERVVGNPERMMQVVRNLVRNAVQATGSAEKVQLHLERKESLLELRVYDQGPGIAEEKLSRIFDRFYTEGGGAGVGLSVAKSIVEQHGGTLAVSSTMGEGSCFTVILPTFTSRIEQQPEIQSGGVEQGTVVV